ncbi:hypothetical protein K2P97_07140 [bacterium]|nr:hypothetical protein [bacterium]
MVINPDHKFYFVSFISRQRLRRIDITSHYNDYGKEAQFYLDVADFFGVNRIVPRSGEWNLPWKINLMPGLEMPLYDAGFSKNFEQVSDERALEIKKLIQASNAKITLYYSGGIDSVVSLVALLRNLTDEELQNITIALSSESIIEYPEFFHKYIHNKLKIVDSAHVKYSDIQNAGGYAITADQGDSIFGTELATELYYNYKDLLANLSGQMRSKLENYESKVSSREAHYSDYADILIKFFELPGSPEFGAKFYERMKLNIQTSGASVYTLHDFFWWWIFNLKYSECAVRGALYYSDGEDLKKCLHETTINWFNGRDYQLWSMANNNTGQKIRGTTAASYKWAAREYIYSFDKNPWYFRHKLKVSSLKNIFERTQAKTTRIFGMDQDYKVVTYMDPGIEVFMHNQLSKFG